jgi:hypothetical protein
VAWRCRYLRHQPNPFLEEPSSGDIIPGIRQKFSGLVDEMPCCGFILGVFRGPVGGIWLQKECSGAGRKKNRGNANKPPRQRINPLSRHCRNVPAVEVPQFVPSSSRKKIMKKFFALLAVLTVSVALIGCEGKPTTDTTDSTPDTTTPGDDATKPPADTTTPPGDTTTTPPGDTSTTPPGDTTTPPSDTTTPPPADPPKGEDEKKDE